MTQNYYLLLGISHDTVKPEVIRVAAETRMNEFKETFERLQQCVGREEIGEAYDYAILEISPAASLADIKEATQRKITAIKEAYQTLINPASRVAYNQMLAKESSLNDIPMILKQSTEKHPSIKKTPSSPIPTSISSPFIPKQSSGSSLNWLWLFVAVGLIAIGGFLALRFFR